MSAPYLWGYKCAAKGCNSRGKENRLFRFPQGNGPNGKYRVQKWLACAQNPKVNTNHAYLCDLHFNKRQFRDTDRTLLVYGAVPTIRLENGMFIETDMHALKETALQLTEDSSVMYLEETSLHTEDYSAVHYLEEESRQHLKDASEQYIEEASAQHLDDASAVQYIDNTSVRYLEEDASAEYLEDASLQNLDEGSVQHLEDSSVCYLEETSVQHFNDYSVQYHVDSSEYAGEDTLVQDFCTSSVQISQRDTAVQIGPENITIKTDTPEISPSADGYDHIYAKHSELKNNHTGNEKETVQGSSVNSRKIKKASFTVYVMTPKSLSPLRKSKQNSSGRLTNNLQQSHDSQSCLQNVKRDNVTCESTSVLDVRYHNVQNYSNSLSHLQGFTSCKQVTSREKKLIVLVSKKVRSLRQIKKKYENQNLNFKSVCCINSELVRELDSFSKPMSLASVHFLVSRVFCKKKRLKAIKWSLEDRVHALALYKRLPKCYALLSTIYAVPSRRMLDNTLSRVTLRPGFNKHIFESLGRITSSMDLVDRTCLLLFDEMPLDECLQYDSITDTVLGFEDWGHLGRRDKIGSHALVFMLKGLYKRWKQPVMFFFTAGNLSVELLRSVLQSCLRAGLNVVATVCNMTVNNTRLLKRLGASEDKPVLHFGKSMVVTLYNPPHLLVCMRDMLFKYDVFVKHNLGGKIVQSKASWSVVRRAYDIDCRREPLRLLCKLTDDHMEPLGEVAEELVVASQVLSHTMAATICYFTSEGLLNSSALATAHFAEFCNKLFDSMNGTSRPQGIAEIRGQICKESENTYLQFWDESISELEQWKVMNSSIEGSGLKHTEFFRPLCLGGWITTLRGMKLLWQKLKDLGFTHVEPKMMNLDIIQHLFVSVRVNSGSKVIPTVSQFMSSLKTVMLNQLACFSLEKADCAERYNMFQLLKVRDLVQQSSRDVPTDVFRTIKLPCSNFSLAYVACCIVNKISMGSSCHKCKKALLATTPDEYARCAAIFRVSSDKCPSEKLLLCVAYASRVLETVLPRVAHNDSVLSRVASVLKERLSFDWLEAACSQHAEQVQDQVLTIVSHAFMPQWCRNRSRQVTDFVEIKVEFCKIRVPEHR